MARPLTVGLSLLQKCLSQQQGNESLQLAVEVCEYFEKPLSTAEQDLAVNDVFRSNHSLLQSLQKSIGQRKAHKNANIKLLELIQTLMEKYESKVSQYVKEIVETMLLFYLSSSVSAKEKEHSLQIMQFLVKKDLCNDVDMSELLFHLLKIKNEKKPTARVLQLTYELMGLIAKEYPGSLLSDYDTQIRDLYFQTLETTLLNQQEYSFLSLCGALNGFTYFLTNFAPCPSTQPMICQRIYECAFKLSDPGDIKDKTAFRAALNLIEKHASLFSEQLYTNHQYWHKTLLQWLSLPNWTDRKTAIGTLHAFHQELAQQLENRHSDGDVNILKFYLNFFKATLQSKDSRPYEIRIAIIGFGVFSKACKHLLPTSLVDLLDVVMLRTEYTSIDNSQNKDILEHYPAFVQALSEIMEHTSELSAIQISSLQNIVIELMKNFYLLSRAHHEMVVTSLLKTFGNLSKLGTILDDVLEKVIMQGVIWACSHEIKLTANTNWETQKDWKEHITYENFIRLWLGLLDYAEEEFEVKERIHKHFMNTLFVMIEKLDLSTKKRIFKDSNGEDQILYFCNPNLDLVPVKPKDFYIFFNIVDFYNDILTQQSDKSHINFFTKFANQFLKSMVAKCFEYPLVSGFLKFLEVAFRILNKPIIYEPIIKHIEDQTIENLRSLIHTTIPQCLQTSGELQISCLRLMFSLPVFLLTEFSQAIVPVFRIGFDIGRSVYFMASITLTALERLTTSLKENDFGKLSSLLESVLPCLNTYLQSSDLQSESKVDVQIVQFRRNKMAKKIFKADDVDSELLKLQKRIVLYLGTLEPCHCIQMIENDHQEKPVLTKLTAEQNIRVKLYYPQLTPTIFLDTLLPRICYLATSSSNRKTKIAACELTHAVVLYLIGTGNYRGHVWKRLCADILILGSDGDDAVKQMFEPMLMQIIRYMTRRSQILHAGVGIFCEQLMEGISHPSNTAIRDLSARCLREFVKWNMKELTNNLTNEIGALPILKKLKLYSFDSDHNKRCGAALAFNNLYRIIREDNKLISVHWLSILHTFAVNFIMCEEIGGDIESTYDQISTCMDHIVRVLFERKDIFNQPDQHRITPGAFNGNCLKDAMIWLFKQCGAKQQFYRRKCQQMFLKLAPCVNGFNSTMDFVRRTQRPIDVLKVLEGSASGTNGIAGRPNLTHITDGREFLPGLYAWLQQLLRSLDCHIWIMSDGLYDDKELRKNSTLLAALTVFLTEIHSLPLSQIYQNLRIEATDSRAVTIGDNPKIASIKREIIVRLIDYIIKVVPVSTLPNESFWNAIVDPFNLLVCNLIFRPNEFGFHLKDKSFISNVQSRLVNVIDVVKAKAPPRMTDALLTALTTKFKSHYDNLAEYAEQQLHLNAVTTQHQCTVEGLKLVVRSIKFVGVTAGIAASADQLIADLFNGTVEERQGTFFARNILPDIRVYANNILKIALSVKDATKQLATLLSNQNELNQTGALGTLTYGSHFMDIFRPSIYEYFFANAETSIAQFVSKLNASNVPHISRILVQFSQFIYKWNRYDDNSLKCIVRGLLDVWTRIADISSEMEYNQSICLNMIDLMIHTALICPFPLHEISARTQGLQTWILQLLNSVDKSLELKTRVISLVPCIIGPNQNEHHDLQQALEGVQQKHFPLHSNEFPVGSLERAGYVNALEAILKAMVASKSSVLLVFIIRLTAADPKHILEYSIQQHLESFLTKQSAARQQNCLDIPFKLFCDTSMEPTIRLSIMKRFLLRMIKYSYVDSLVLFYAAHIKEIDQMLRTHYGLGSSGWQVESALTSRIGGFQLVEALFASVSKERLVEKTNPILLAFVGTGKAINGNELTVELTKKAQGTRSDIFVTDDVTAKELYRKYQCASFNALSAIVCNTQTRLEYYERLLFKEYPEKNSFIWRNIVDQHNDLYSSTFKQEFDDFPKMKQRMVSIRCVDGELSDRVQRRYIKSQSVFDSSLSQDISKLDLSSSSIRTDGEVNALEPTPSTLTVKFEKNLITDHESMAVLCAVFTHMFEQKITPFAENPLARRKSPDWVERIATVIGDSREHRNIRLFLVKSVEICRSVFRCYAHTMARPVLQLLVDECAGSHMSSFIVDLIVMLLEWKSSDYAISSFEEISLVSSLLEFLMKHAWNDRKEVFKQNLELIKTVVENWRDVLSLKKQFLFDSISRSTQSNSRDNICGLQINAIILANNLIPWTDTSRDAYLHALVLCLQNEYAAVTQPAAQTLGMALAIVEPDEENACLRELNALLLKLKEKQKVKEFIDILYGVHKSYPLIVDKFFMTLGNHIAILTGTPKRVCLEMFLSRMDFYESEIGKEIQALGVKKLMKGKDYQLLALHILNKALPKMKYDEVAAFMDEICEFVDSSVVDCRDVMYEMLMFICDTFADTDLFKRSSSILLNGLIDTSPQIQTRIFNFWSNPARLPANLDDRILYLFEKLFDEQSEKHFLSYCTQLLLEPAILHPDSKRPVFEHQYDSETKLNEYDIDVSWKTQNSLIKAPLFVDTKQENEFSDDLISTQHIIRQTNTNLAFEPTKDPMTMSQTSDNFSFQSASSFLFSQQPTTLDRRSRRVNAAQSSGDSKMYANLRHRIVTDKEKTSRSHALAAIERNSYSIAVQAESKVKKEQHVQLYRRYRYGEYPDLLINSLALLLPLKGLVKRDKILARQLLISIFSGGVKELGDTSSRFIRAVGQSMQTIFMKSKNYEPLVFGALMEIALINPSVIDLPIDTITMLSMANNMASLGCLYVENRLHFNNTLTPRAGKMTKSTVDGDEDRWLKLSKLYRNLTEHDVVASIFGDKLNVDDKITRAIEFEQNNDYVNAQKIYLEVILRDNKLEVDFGYEAYYKCFEYLSDWSTLSSTLQRQYESFDELWSDEFNFENILPLVIKSELRMILNGNTANRQDFLNELKKWLLMTDRSDHIKSNFGEELMMFHIANTDYFSARVHSEQHLTAFIADWCTLNGMSHKIRYKKLLNARNVAEIHKYSQLLSNVETERREIDAFCQLWKHSDPQPFDSIILWDAMTTYRMFVGEILKFSIADETIKQNISASITDIMFKLLNLSLAQKNVKLSDVIFDKLSSYEHQPNDPLSLDWHLARTKQSLLKTHIEPSTQQKLDLYCNAWTKLNENVLQNALHVQYADKQITALRYMSDISFGIANLISNENVSNDTLERLLLDGSIQSVRGNRSERLREHSYTCLVRCVDIANENVNGVKVLADSNFRLAEYLLGHSDNQLHYVNNADEMMIASLLRGMNYGSKEARQYFPRLLQIKSLADSQTKKVFDHECSRVPAWMFLGWISQIISEVKFNRDGFIDQLLLRLSKAYPAAVAYPFKLSHSQYVSSCYEVVPDRPLIQRIKDIIHDPLIDSFVNGLTAVCIPYKMLYYHLTTLYKEFRELSENQFEKRVKSILDTVFPPDGRYHGVEYDKLKAYYDPVRSLKSLSVVDDRLAIANELKNLIAKLRADIDSQRDHRIELVRYSPWLAKYQWCGEDNHLELPGQYSGDVCPNQSEHIKIIKFDEKIFIFTSLRMPIKIKIYCSDGKTYQYLVKYGEDMRQDERIQQIFHHMSDLLKADEKCRNHRLNVGGYRIIPISTVCGILSFVEDTVAMLNFFSQSLKRIEGNVDKINECRQEFMQFLRVHSIGEKDQNDFQLYGRSILNYNRMQIINNFRKLEYKLPEDVIKKALIDLSVSPESFFVLRTNFVSSMATMNIAHWVLGIGDRHLSNILISRKDAAMLGIDFNLAFGAGTRDTTIPELVPFRLSPHLVNVMSPFGTTGLITKTMVHTLRTFRLSKRLLTSYMESFVKEPTIDWLHSARSHHPNESISSTDSDWEPSMRIKIAERKLSGANPTHLFAEELRSGAIAKFPSYNEGYLNLLNGHKQHNVRARLPENGLTVEEQVQCLIDMATDPALLGILYYGFQPWV